LAEKVNETHRLHGRLLLVPTSYNPDIEMRGKSPAYTQKIELKGNKIGDACEVLIDRELRPGNTYVMPVSDTLIFDPLYVKIDVQTGQEHQLSFETSPIHNTSIAANSSQSVNPLRREISAVTGLDSDTLLVVPGLIPPGLLWEYARESRNDARGIDSFAAMAKGLSENCLSHRVQSSTVIDCHG
jgi:hypothetical protein